MFFKLAAHKDKIKIRNPFISTLADNYLDFSLKNSDEKKVRDAIKGKFASLKYTLSGFDPSELPYKDKVKLISVLYDFHIQDVGPIEAKGTLEELGLKAKGRFGSTKSFDEGISDLPHGVFEAQRFKGLDREQLEERAKKLLVEIEEVRALTNASISQHTVELVAERDVLEAILYNASDGVFALDRSGNIITFNKSMEVLTGYTFDEVENKSSDEYIRLFDSSEPLDTKSYCSMTGVSPKRVAFKREKLTLVARNGKKKYVSMISTSIPEGREVNVGCIATLTDITKDIDLENMKLDFVSIAAHELRTPLTSLRGYLSLLEEEITGDLEEKHSDYLEKSVLSAGRLHILVENLLNISRIEKGTLTLNITKQNWIVLVKQIVEDLQGKASSAGVELSYTVSKGDVPDVYVDPTTILEVLSNLLDNAIRYTGEGGRVTVIIEPETDQVVTHVKDTGIGIPRASLPHLFKKFYRVSTTVLRAGEKGTGLGLFIAKAIVKMHEGKIWVESEEGKGSTFSFSVLTSPLKMQKK